jgi:hypothetical protein
LQKQIEDERRAAKNECNQQRQIFEFDAPDLRVLWQNKPHHQMRNDGCNGEQSDDGLLVDSQEAQSLSYAPGGRILGRSFKPLLWVVEVGFLHRLLRHRCTIDRAAKRPTFTVRYRLVPLRDG